MSMDNLQEKIRKLKNPSALELGFSTSDIPDSVRLQSTSQAEALGFYCRSVLSGLKGVLPAVRISFSAFALLGLEGLTQLQNTLTCAAELGYYVLLDAPEILSVSAAKQTAQLLLGEDTRFPCDGLVISGYLGTDIIKPFLPYCKKGKKDIFVVCRTANKSAPELQDLLTGTRLVHAAAADHINRCGAGTEGKYGYSQLGILSAASSSESLRSLRSKYPAVFMLVDGFDYPGANAKNCFYAFDKYGHGAIVCAGSSITGAWTQAEGSDGTDYLEHSRAAAERMKKNITRYVTIL